MKYTIIVDDCRAALAAMEPDSVDAVVTDPPYEYGFMGKAWDNTGVAFDPATWAACLRVLKPGGHLLSFGATRTSHRIACAIEDAGFEIRDTIAWMFGSGFPKSLDVSKAIDRAAGATREVVGVAGRSSTKVVGTVGHVGGDYMATAPATPSALQWQGWGTALKPAMEPIIVARKPLQGMTVAACVLKHGTGALNIDGCRLEITDGAKMARQNKLGDNGWKNSSGGPNNASLHGEPSGRWPANVILDPEAGAMLDAQSGQSKSASGPQLYKRAATTAWVERGGSFTPGREWSADGHGDSGGASRFFYSPKADAGERDAGLGDLPPMLAHDLVDRVEGSAGLDSPRSGSGRTAQGRRSTHATVKPIDLMRYLCRLVTPPGGVVLDPFAGSGTTLAAGLLEGFSVIGVEMGTDHACIAWHRCRHWASRSLAPGVTARSGAERPTQQRDLF